jgi:hypothetical protein
MSAPAFDRIEIACDRRGGCNVVGVSRDGSRMTLASKLTPFVARDHASEAAEIYRCGVVNVSAAVRDDGMRTQRWGG